MHSAIGISNPSIITALFSSWIAIAVYVLTAVAVMKMGRKIGAGAPWLAWIPGASEYALGRVADEDARRRGQSETKFRIILPILYGIETLLSLVLVIGVVVVSIGFIMSLVALTGAIFAGDTHFFDNTDMEGLAGVVGALLVMGIVSILLSIPRFFALWHVYRVFCPDRAVLFLLLNIFLDISIPITLMIAAARKPIPKFTFDDILPHSPNYDLWNDNASGTDTL